MVKADIVAAGGIRFLTPLLESKQHPARWNARQVGHQFPLVILHDNGTVAAFKPSSGHHARWNACRASVPLVSMHDSVRLLPLSSLDLLTT